MSPSAAIGPSPGDTRILKWPDGKKAVFQLQFDDNSPTQLRRAIPELCRRRMVGTIYVNPANEPWKTDEESWLHPAPGIEYANHTYSHVGATSFAQLDDELARCGEVIARCYPERPWPRLLSFGQPGGVPWTVTPAEVERALAEHHLINRPQFKGYPFQFQDGLGEILALVDTALANGGMEYYVFHGVGGDWHSTRGSGLSRSSTSSTPIAGISGSPTLSPGTSTSGSAMTPPSPCRRTGRRKSVLPSPARTIRGFTISRLPSKR